MKHKFLFSILLATALLQGGDLSAKMDDEFTKNKGYVLRNGKLIDKRDVATLPVQEHYSKGIEALKNEQWKEASAQFRIVKASFPETTFGIEALYYAGVAFSHIGEYEHANDCFTDYLTLQPNGKHFENILEHKLHVADAFRQGARRHLFGYDKFPKWLPGDSKAIEIYDEIAEIAPSHDFAAKALFHKSQFLVKMRRYVEAVEAAHLLVHRFPKNEHVAEAYLEISNAFLQQCKEENQNPDLLPLAQINLRRFSKHLPREERIAVVEERIEEMKEVCAEGLIETAEFYERTGKPRASVLYYITAIRRFPSTQMAIKAKERLQVEKELEVIALDMHFSKELWL